jgi:uncharacterized membrane protein YoaK (UPF0700 family)
VPAQNHAEKSAVAILLTFAAGCVDIVGYLSAYHTFTAHMTGNTVHLENSLFGGDAREAGLAALVLIAFVGGSALLLPGLSALKLHCSPSWHHERSVD